MSTSRGVPNGFPPRRFRARSAAGPRDFPRFGLAAATLLAALLTVAFAARAQTAASQVAAPRLDFHIDEGRNLNRFVRDGDVAAHLVLRAGRTPRIIVAFPAGNSGVGVWFAPTTQAVAWQLGGSPQPIREKDSRGRVLRGIEAVVSVDAPTLSIRRAVLSSVRVLRDYEANAPIPAQVAAELRVQGNLLSWERDRLDGAAGYRLTIEALDGSRVDADGTMHAVADAGAMRLRLVALTGETPLTPLGGQALLRPNARQDERAREVLAFLSYREKLLAGSWRFDTYFGRDTLISLRLLAPVLQADATESALGSVLSRLSPEGEVAHEEGIGEFAVLQNESAGRQGAEPSYDYAMVDEDFLLAPVAAHCLLGEAALRGRAAAFLASLSAANEPMGAALVRNFVWVVRRTQSFASDPTFHNLVGLKPGRDAGNWRDSQDGLGGGRYAYDVNVALVPAALEGIDQLLRSGLLDPYVSDESRRVLARAGAQGKAWTQHSAGLFHVTVSSEDARERLESYARQIGVDAKPALASLGSRALELNALALDVDGKPIPVVHSDDSFLLLFGMPTPQAVERAVSTMMRPFPAGLLTPVGLLVANPAFAGPELQREFTSSAYHGTVVWSWQQEMLIAGIDRQLARNDLPMLLRARLNAARTQVAAAIKSTDQLRTSELWSWSFANGAYHVEPFGQRGADVDESNAAQLWSTVSLARLR